MTVAEWQKIVDNWISKYGVRYFSELTNLAQLTEEVGELARLISRTYGDQSFKESQSPDLIKDQIADEMSDIIFVVTCMANQMDIDLSASLDRNLMKKTSRDHTRHLSNPKLKDQK